MKLRLLLILLVLSSCTQMPVNLEEDIFEAYGNQIITKSGELHNDYLYSFEEDSLYIASLMGNIRTIDNFETIYVVNEELVFFKEKLYESRQNVSPRLNGHLIVDAAQHIYLDITCDNESDVTPLIEAIDEWNSIPDCNIFFTSKYHELNPYNSDGWFVAGVQVGANSYSILPELSCSETGIHIEAPTSNNLPGYNIWVDVNHEVYSNLSDSQKKYAIMHALGHLIGLSDSNEYNWIGGTSNHVQTIMDSYSYLQQWGMEWSGFSIWDKEDMASIYPLLPDVVSFTVSPYVLGTMNTNIEYLITPYYEFIKEPSNISYRYTIRRSGGVNGHSMTENPDGTLSVVFYIKQSVAIELSIYIGDKVVGSYTQNYKVLGGMEISDEVTIGQPFTIQWDLENHETLDIIASEIKFDGDDRNISISKQSSNEYIICLNDYGAYEFLIEKKNSVTGAVVKSHLLKVYRFYRPAFYFPDFYGTDDVFDYRLEVFQVGRICPERLSEITFTSSNTPYSIVVGESATLQERLYVHIHEKFYRQAFIPPYRVDRGPVTIENYQERVLNKGANSTIVLPAGRNGHINNLNPGSATYKGYFAVVVPEDITVVE